ncbi:MAG: peroxide stress protein YaaA [Clostridia bacterium]|nr:peroxide stress protein YaaA [Clostridia bacterium]
MKIIISPAKKMNIEQDVSHKSLPVFLGNTQEIKNTIQGLSYEALKDIWKCNDNLAKLNFDRFCNMDLERSLSPAIFSYEGLQYQYIGAGVLDNNALEYIADNLRIISGFYGVLRPFDGVTPYRLEMQAKISIDNKKNLYDYWGDKLYKEIFKYNDMVLNLASKEYSECIEKHLKINDKFITCLFYENINGKFKQKATLAKMARGSMVRFLAENNIDNIDDIKKFNDFGFSFNNDMSSEDKLIFVK